MTELEEIRARHESVKLEKNVGTLLDDFIKCHEDRAALLAFIANQSKEIRLLREVVQAGFHVYKYNDWKDNDRTQAAAKALAEFDKIKG